MKKFFQLDDKPLKGLMAFEWAVLIYTAITLIYIFFAWTKLPNPESMVWFRVRNAVTLVALWGVYRILPCKLTKSMRAVVQLLMLAMWYPDTYEINRILPNLDHYFASMEQSLFGFQPALVFAQNFPSPVVSELLDFGYYAYYYIIFLVLLFYLLFRYNEFYKATLMVLGSFFVYYLIFDFLPVVGPTFYYKAVGVDQISQGIFPALGDYFNSHTECLTSPGYTDGVFYKLVESAKAAGERPTAAFPSSHVGMATICMLLALRTKNKPLFFIFLPVYCFLCMATVYIQAHYLIDAIAGFITGVALYFIFQKVKK